MTVNDGTAGSRSYGSGLTGRSRLIGSPRVSGGEQEHGEASAAYQPPVPCDGPAAAEDNGAMTDVRLDDLLTAVEGP